MTIQRLGIALTLCAVFVAGAAGFAQGRAMSRMEAASAASQHGDFDTAILLLGKAITDENLAAPELARAHRDRASAFYGRAMHRREQDDRFGDTNLDIDRRSLTSMPAFV